MKIARLGAAAGAAGVIAVCAAGPAFATGTTPPPASGDVSKAPGATTPPGKPGSAPVADVNPKFFYGGDTLTFTYTNCAAKPTIMDLNNLFVSTHSFASTGKGSWAAKETTHKNLVPGKEYKVKVDCPGYPAVTFSTRPQKKPKPTPTPTSPAPTTSPTGVPSGAPQTGDGSSSGGGNTGLMIAGVGVVVVGLAGGTFLYSRRRSSAGA